MATIDPITGIHPQTFVTQELAKTWLRNEGLRPEDDDLLDTLINGSIAFMLSYTNRRVLALKDDQDSILERRDGDGSNVLFLREILVHQIKTLVLDWQTDSPTSVVVPLAGQYRSDECYFIPSSGEIVLTKDLFYEGVGNIEIDYVAGYRVDSQEAIELQRIQLDLLSWRVNRWRLKGYGVDQINRQETDSISFAGDSIPEDILQRLRRFRRAQVG